MRNLIIVGCGHWGKNYVRVFSSLLGANRITVVDQDSNALKAIASRYPGIEVNTDLSDALSDPGRKMAVISTPASTHSELITQCLKADLDVLSEKPLTSKASDARRIAALAARRGRIVMMGMTFLYNPGVIKLRDLYAKGKCGDIYYMKATRTHLGLVRSDVDAVWDLAPHDISIFNYLVSSSPVSVSAVGGCYLKDKHADVAFLVLEYPDGLLGHIHVSWADSNKERRIDVVGSKARLVFDDLNALERVKIYEKGISAGALDGDSYGEFLYALRDGAIISPKISGAEPLVELCKAFLRSVRSRKEPVASLKHGVDVVQILEAADRSIARGGARVAIR